jgi:hypothetical protein
MKTSHLAVLALALTGFSSEAMAGGADGHRAVVDGPVSVFDRETASSARPGVAAEST